MNKVEAFDKMAQGCKVCHPMVKAEYLYRLLGGWSGTRPDTVLTDSDKVFMKTFVEDAFEEGWEIYIKPVDKLAKESKYLYAVVHPTDGPQYQVDYMKRVCPVVCKDENDARSLLKFWRQGCPDLVLVRVEMKYLEIVAEK